jgi:predicted dehydrogenase
MSEPIGVGLIGANPEVSWAAASHLPAIDLSPDFELRAVSTRRPESAAAAAAAFEVTAYHDNAKLLAHPGIDLVVVAVRTPNHREPVLAAIEAGKDIYCEWPLGNGLVESEELAAAAKEAGIRTFIGLQARVSPAVRYLRELIADGYVGRVTSSSVVSTCWVYGGTTSPNNAYQLDSANGANMLTIQTAHLLDAMALCLGEFAEVSASMTTAWPEVEEEGTGAMISADTPDQIALVGLLENGASTSVHVKGGTSRAVNMEWLVTGTEGELLLTGASAHLSTDDQGPPSLSGGRGAEAELKPIEIPDRHRWAPAEVPPGPAYNMAQQYGLVGRDLRDGTHLVPGFDEAVKRLRLIDEIADAARSGERATPGLDSATAG